MHEILRLRLADGKGGLSFIAVRKHMMIARSAAACALVRNDRLESTLRSDWVRSFRKAGGGGQTAALHRALKFALQCTGGRLP